MQFKVCLAVKKCPPGLSRCSNNSESKNCLLSKELILALRINDNCWRAICTQKDEWNKDSELCFMRDDLIS